MKQDRNAITEYLTNMALLFEKFCPEQKAEAEEFLIVESMQRWFRSLPQVTLTFQQADGLKPEEIKRIKAFRKLFSRTIPPEDLLFRQLPELFGSGSDLAHCLRQTARMKRWLELHVRLLKQEMAERVRRIFGGRPHEDLLQCLKAWQSLQHLEQVPPLPAPAEKLAEDIRCLSTHDEEEIISNLAKLVTGCYVEDWDDSFPDKFTEGLRQVKQELEGKQKFEGKQEKTMVYRELYFTERTGKWIRYYLISPENTSKVRCFRSLVERVLHTEGACLQTGEQAAVLMDVVEQLLEELPPWNGG